MAIGINLVAGDDSFDFTVYSDGIDGSLTFMRSESFLIVEASGIYKMNYGDFEREHLTLPAKVVVASAVDSNGEPYYFGKNDEGIDLNIDIEKPNE